MRNSPVIFLISMFFALLIGFLLSHFVKVGLPVSIGIGLLIFILPLIFQKPELGLAMVAFFLPFERVPSIELGGISIKIDHILIIFVFVIFLIKNLIAKKLTIPKDPVRYLIILFISTLTFSLSTAINLERSLQVLVFMFLMFIVYLATTFIVSNKKVLIYVLYGLIFGAIFQGALGLFQFAGDAVGISSTITLLKEGYDKSTFGFARVQGTAIEPLYFANYILIPFFLSVILLLRGQSGKLMNKIIFYALSGVLMINFILAISRGAYIAMAATILIMIISQYKLILRAKAILTTLVIVLLVSVGSYLALVKSEPRAIDEFVGHLMINDATEGESVVSRVNASQEAYEIFLDHPTFGAGLGNYGPIVQNDPPRVPDSGWFIVNNEYMELLAENGVVGLLMFLVLLVFVFARALLGIKKETDQFVKAVLIGLTLALFGVLVQYLTFSTLYIFHIWFLIGLISATSYLSLHPVRSGGSEAYGVNENAGENKRTGSEQSGPDLTG